MEKVALGLLSVAALYKIISRTKELPVMTIDISALIWQAPFGNSIALIEHVQSYVEYLQQKYTVYILIEPQFKELSAKFTNYICAPKTQWMEILLRLNSTLHIESDGVFGQHLKQITTVLDLSKSKLEKHIRYL